MKSFAEIDDKGYRFDNRGNKIHETAQIYAGVYLGENNYIGPFCIIRGPAERRGYEKDGLVVIGNNNVITGHVTIDAGTELTTEIRNDCYIMKHAHVGHDAFLGNKVTLAPGVKVGGFCRLFDGVNCGMNAAIHPRQTIGAYAMIGMGCIIPNGKEVRPFGKYVRVAEYIGKNERGIEKARLTKNQVIQLTNQYYENKR